MQIGSASSVLPSDLLGLTRFLTNTKDNVTAFSDAEIVAFLNSQYSELQTFILTEVMNDWKENTVQGNGVGSIDLVAGTKSYAFPSEMLTLDRVEISYNGEDNSYRLADVRKLNSIDKALANTVNESPIIGSRANPVVYLRDNYIYLDPVPDAAVTAGLLVYATIRKTDLAIGGSGDELTPIFDPAFHNILAYGAATEYLISNDQDKKAANLLKLMNEKKARMVLFYSNREQATKHGIRPFERDMT